MAIFAPSASDPSLLLGTTYPPAAKAANAQCGDGYAPGPETVVATPTPPVPANTAKSAAGRTVESALLRMVLVSVGLTALVSWAGVVVV